MCFVRANQKPERPVSTRPLSGISVGRTTSNVEMRSLATSKSRSSSSAYSSRTFSLPTCRAASGMNRFLLSDEGVEAVEHGLDVTHGRVEVEDGVEIDAACQLAIGAHELDEVRLLFPCTHRVCLDGAVRIVPREPGLDEREQQTMAEEQTVTGVEVAAHALWIDDETLDDPVEAIEHVVECKEGVGNDDSLRRRLRDVALVPERNVLHPDERVRAHDAGEPADSLCDFGVPLVRHCR